MVLIFVQNMFTHIARDLDGHAPFRTFKSDIDSIAKAAKADSPAAAAVVPAKQLSMASFLTTTPRSSDSGKLLTDFVNLIVSHTTLPLSIVDNEPVRAFTLAQKGYLVDVDPATRTAIFKGVNRVSRSSWFTNPTHLSTINILARIAERGSQGHHGEVCGPSRWTLR
jgi:hypothetical protein